MAVKIDWEEGVKRITISIENHSWTREAVQNKIFYVIKVIPLKKVSQLILTCIEVLQILFFPAIGAIRNKMFVYILQCNTTSAISAQNSF